MSLSVSGVTPVFFTRSSQEEKSKRPSSTNWLLVSPMLEKIPTPTESEVSLLRSLMSCGPIPLDKVRWLFLKEKSPRVELGHLLLTCWANAAQPGGPAALAQLRQASWAR